MQERHEYTHADARTHTQTHAALISSAWGHLDSKHTLNATDASTHPQHVIRFYNVGRWIGHFTDLV